MSFIRMRNLRPAAIALILLAIPVTMIAAEADDQFFANQLYPVFINAGCNMCHNDNGVASRTRLAFPPADAKPEQIRSFGYDLAKLVDRSQPAESPLVGKPTNRIAHTGGERIKPGSETEQLLSKWVEYLSTVPEDKLASLQTPKLQAIGERDHTVRRLTHSQYNNIVRDLLGDQSRPADKFPQEDFIHGFKNQAEGQGVPPLLAEAYSEAAERLAMNAFRAGDSNGLIPCKPASVGDTECRGKFVTQFGRRAFRRPLTKAESEQYNRLFAKQAQVTGDFLKGAQIVVEAMLQSPSFLFRIHPGEDARSLQYETASRLALLLWNTAPTDDLLDAAERGELGTREEAAKTARRMLDDPRARRALDEFLAQWLRFDRVLNMIRGRREYREFSPELAAAMTEETRRMFQHLVWNDQDFMEFFTANYSFVSSDLAKVYGIDPPEEEFGKVSFPAESQRAGIIGQASYLAVTSKPEDTSPTERGLFVREHFLCEAVPPPPPGVSATLPALTDAKPMTNRERLQVHLKNATCSSCHRLVDPIGFGLEQYDAIGRYREKLVLTIFPTRDEQQRKIKTKETVHTLDIDTSAEVRGIPNSSFSNPKQLGQILAKDRACQKCMVKQYFRYAMGRSESETDQPAIESILSKFQDSHFHFRELIIALVTSDLFLGGPS